MLPPIGAQAACFSGRRHQQGTFNKAFSGFEGNVTPVHSLWKRYLGAYWQTISQAPTPWIVGRRGFVTQQYQDQGVGDIAPLLELRAPDPASGETTNYGTIFGPDTIVNFTKKYNHFLPSVNVSYDFGAVLDGLIGRFAYSKTLTRPQLLDLTPRYVFSAAARGNLRGSQGNPELEPFVADNYDLSLEYYFGESNYFTVGLFRKDVDDLIVKTLNTVVFDVITDISGDPTVAGGKARYGILRPNNARSAKVEGLEVGFQYTLNRGVASGLGITANATFVDSEVEQPPNITAEIFPIEGLGDSRTLFSFMRKHRFSARLAGVNETTSWRKVCYQVESLSLWINIHKWTFVLDMSSGMTSPSLWKEPMFLKKRLPSAGVTTTIFSFWKKLALVTHLVSGLRSDSVHSLTLGPWNS